jgi:hypothetical protein
MPACILPSTSVWISRAGQLLALAVFTACSFCFGFNCNIHILVDVAAGCFGRLWRTLLRVKSGPLNFLISSKFISLVQCGCTVDLSALSLAPFFFRRPLLLTPSFQLRTETLLPFALPSPSRPHTTATAAETPKTAQDPAASNAPPSTSSTGQPLHSPPATLVHLATTLFQLPCAFFLSFFYEAATHVSKTENR